MTRTTRLWRVAAMLVAATTTIVACGGDDDGDAEDVTTTAGGATTSAGATTTSAPGGGEGSGGPGSISPGMPASVRPQRHHGHGLRDAHRPARPAPGAAAGLQMMMAPIYDRLTSVNDDLEVEGMLAESWEFAPDGKSMTMKLRKGISFHDGTPFDAAAVKVNIERAKGPTANTAGYLSSVASVEVVDPSTVKFNLQNGGAQLPSMLSASAGMMVSPKAIAERSADLALNPGDAGTGPYKVVTFKPNESIVYAQAQAPGTHWDKGAGLLKQFEWRYIATGAQRINAVRASDIDFGIATGTDVKNAEDLVKSGQLTGREITLQTTEQALMIKASRETMSNVKLRQAMNFATDKESLAEGLFSGNCEVATQYLPESHWAYSDKAADLYDFDLDKAKSLVAESGVANPTLQIAYFPIYELPAQAMQAMLSKAGINVTVLPQQPADIAAGFREGKYDSIQQVLSSTVADPTFIMDFVYLGGQNLVPEAERAPIQALLVKANDPLNTDEERAAVWDDIWLEIGENAYAVPICHATRSGCSSTAWAASTTGSSTRGTARWTCATSTPRPDGRAVGRRCALGCAVVPRPHRRSPDAVQLLAQAIATVGGRAGRVPPRRGHRMGRALVRGPLHGRRRPRRPVAGVLDVLAALAAAVPQRPPRLPGHRQHLPAPGGARQAGRTVDIVSGGRAVLGLGAGWQENEHAAYSIQFYDRAPAPRLLEESCKVITRPARNERTNFDGRYYSCSDAPLAPKPVQAQLPILIGGGGEKVTMRIAAPYGRGVERLGPAEAPGPKGQGARRPLRAHRARPGRDPPLGAVPGVPQHRPHLGGRAPAPNRARSPDAGRQRRTRSSPPCRPTPTRGSTSSSSRSSTWARPSRPWRHRPLHQRGGPSPPLSPVGVRVLPAVEGARFLAMFHRGFGRGSGCGRGSGGGRRPFLGHVPSPVPAQRRRAGQCMRGAGSASVCT